MFSSNYNRTEQTADVIANDKGLEVEFYNPNKLDKFADESIIDNKDGVILVVGHSNTTPSLLNILIGKNDYSIIPETEYDNLFLVSVSEKGRAKVIHMKY